MSRYDHNLNTVLSPQCNYELGSLLDRRRSPATSLEPRRPLRQSSTSGEDVASPDWAYMGMSSSAGGGEGIVRLTMYAAAEDAVERGASERREKSQLTS